MPETRDAKKAPVGANNGGLSQKIGAKNKMIFRLTRANMPVMDDTAQIGSPPLTRGLVLLMAVTGGATVANLYYNQPLLSALAKDFHLTISQAGVVAMLTQIGYGLGMLFLVPLGDMIERRRLIVLMICLSAIALTVTGIAHSAVLLCVASLATGFTSMVPQLLVPFAAELALPHEKGRAVGTVLSGMLIGILLARTASGIIGSHYGWRAVYFAAANLMVVFAFIMRTRLPQSRPTFAGSYAKLLRSIVGLVSQYPTLRESALMGGMFFAAFSVFWSTLIFKIERPPFLYGASQAGLFGLLGAAAALTAPLVGRVADKKGPRFTITIALLLTTSAFAVMWIFENSLAGLILGVLLMDIGVQSGHVSNQTRVFRLDPGARSRLNTVYMFVYFAGGASGSLLGSLAWQHGRWPGVCMAALFFLAIGTLAFVNGGLRSRREVKQ